MRQTDPRVSYRQHHPLPILTRHPSDPIGLVGPKWTWDKRGGSWQSKWYLTPKQNRERRNKLRAKCIRDISAGELGRKYLNNCKSILKTKDYLRADRTGNEVIGEENA